MRALLIFLLAFQTPLLNANPLFNGFTAEYDVIRNDILLGVSKRWLVARDQGRKLDYASTTYPEGLVSLFVSDRFMEHSLVHVTANGLQPWHYEYQRTGGKKEIAFQARFDWQKKRILLSNQAKPRELLPHSQDLMSFQLALMQGLYQGRRRFDFNIVDRNHTRLHTLEYRRTEQVQSSLGKLDVLQLEQKTGKDNYQFTFWCAKQLNFLPIKIRKTKQNGDFILLRLRSFNRQAFRLSEPDSADEDET